jgi:hypothetical protein
MTQDDNQTGLAGVTAGETVNPSEATAKEATAEKDTKAPPTEEVTPAKSEDADAGDDAGDKPRKPSGSARKAERIRELEARIIELEQRAVAPEPAKIPKLEDFPDWDSHQVALAKYAAREAVQEASRTTTESELERARGDLAAEAVRLHQSRVEQARERIPDFDKTLKAYQGPAPSEPLSMMVLESDKSELLALHFATRPELVRELNALPPANAARRIGQIEARLSYPTAKTVSDAPPPVGGLKGAASPSKDAASMSHDELRRMFART